MEAVSSYHPRDILARMSLTRHEEIGRVGRVGRGCYKHHRENVRNKSCVSGSWILENDTTHGQTGSTIHRSRRLADRSGKRVATEQGSRPTRPTRVSCVSARMSRECYEDATTKLLRLYTKNSLTSDAVPCVAAPRKGLLRQLEIFGECRFIHVRKKSAMGEKK